MRTVHPEREREREREREISSERADLEQAYWVHQSLLEPIQIFAPILVRTIIMLVAWVRNEFCYLSCPSVTTGI